MRRCLAEPGNEVTVLDTLDPMLKATTTNLRQVWGKIRFVRGDMGDEPLIADVVQGKDVIFNCAAQTSHPLSLQNPIHDAQINCVGNLRLLEAVRLLCPKAIVVYTSSSTVIGRAVGDVIDENHGERPLDIYSANKGAAEKYYRIYHRVHDLTDHRRRAGEVTDVTAVDDRDRMGAHRERGCRQLRAASRQGHGRTEIRRAILELHGAGRAVAANRRRIEAPDQRRLHS